MNITGKLYSIGSEQKVSDTFVKREFIIEENSSKYTQYLLFQLTQDRVDLIDSYGIGDEIKVHFNLRGRLWKDKSGAEKCFNSLEAWKLEGVSSAEEYPPAEYQPQNTPDSDLPF